MGCRITAFSGKQTKEGIDSIKELGAQEVVNSRDLKTVKDNGFTYNTVITTVPHVNKDFDVAFQGMVKPFGKFVQVGIPSYKDTMALDHIGLVFYGREIVG